LTQYAQRVLGLSGEGEAVIRKAIDMKVAFFNRLNIPTRLTDFSIDPDEAAERVRARFEERGTVLGEHKDLTPDKVAAILRLSR